MSVTSFIILNAGENFVDKQAQRQSPQLLIAVAQGNQQAFKQLVDQYSDRLGHFIAAITKDHALAEEIVQDIFLKVWQTRESLISIRDFQKWLFVISKHQAINSLRKAVTIEYGLEEKLPIQVESQEQLLEKERRFCLLDAAIASLPTQQKKVFLLSRRAGRSYKQIAQEMNLSTHTVKKYLQLATNHIIKHIETSATLTFFYFFIK
ncbi:RNA polymerase sigma factor [Arachidicoccus ginsenosidivorans]